jgi:hypothetical protein
MKLVIKLRGLDRPVLYRMFKDKDLPSIYRSYIYIKGSWPIERLLRWGTLG